MAYSVCKSTTTSTGDKSDYYWSVIQVGDVLVAKEDEQDS